MARKRRLGSVTVLPNGRVLARVQSGRRIDGSPRTMSRVVDTEAEAEVAIAQMAAEMGRDPHAGERVLLSWYFLFGAAASALAIWDGSFMAPWAVHSANNLHGALVVGYAASPYKTAPLFMRQGSAPVIEAMTTMTIIFIILALTRVVGNTGKDTGGRQAND